MLLPRPASLTRRTGRFVLDPDTGVRGPSDLVTLVRRELASTGLPLASRDAGPAIEVGLDASLGGEASRLSVADGGVRITGGDQAGVFYAIQSLRQLLPADGYRRAAPGRPSWSVPAVLVEDAPRFAWRGAMLDVVRHFMPKDFLFRWVDLLAMHKYNVCHLHLTDDQGWRFESHRYPRLQEIASWRAETFGDGTPHGGFYHQDDLRELVAYAADRCLTIVPEIDMPGHMRAAIAAYPELGHDPAVRLRPATRWGVKENVLNLAEETLQFCRDILDEVLQVFPSRYVHIGGDECPTVEWAASDREQRRMRARGVDDVAEYQRWFTAQIREHLEERGRALVGWDEIVDAGPVPDALVMGWRSAEHGRHAAALGQSIVMAPQESTYFNYVQSADPTEPGAARLGRIELEAAYAYEPLTGFTEETAAAVVGTQFQIWTEDIQTPPVVEYQAFPRGCALAEIAWSPAGERDLADFLTRLRDHHLPRLDALGVNYRPLSGPRPWQRIANPAPT
ncbi:MAG: beta-N-acetylhexosaminidase [Candidatus Dormiibacterota bacterium]